MERIPYLGQTIHKWQVGPSTFLALPEIGARLMNWNITLGDGSVRDVIYWPELSVADDMPRVKGGNPILFPFCGRSFDAGTIYFWKDENGIRRPMPIHGLARQGDFQVQRLDERGFTALFQPGEEARASYPYNYEFTVSYRFEPLTIFVELRLRNLDTKPIPWSAGHHFYFTVPWDEDLKRSDYIINIPARATLRQNFDDGKLHPGPRLNQEVSLANKDLIDVFHTALKSNAVVFGARGREDLVTIRLGPDRIPDKSAVFVTWTLADDSGLEVDALGGAPGVWSAVRLANGNTIFTSRGGEAKGPQLVEVTADKKVVWVLQDWQDLGDATAVQILDDPGIPEIPGESQH